jgi:hypothetical protein
VGDGFFFEKSQWGDIMMRRNSVPSNRGMHLHPPGYAIGNKNLTDRNLKMGQIFQRNPFCPNFVHEYEIEGFLFDLHQFPLHE